MIRIIFTLSVVAMWALFGIGLAAGTWTGTNWLMLALAHVSCAVVFRNFVYLFSYGYALSMLAVHAGVYASAPSLASALVAGVAALYGIRLWRFIHVRYASDGYAAIRERGERADAAMPLPARIFLWTSVSWLMAFEGMIAWRVAKTGVVTGWVIAGCLVAVLGLVIETLADEQKQAAKRTNPAAPVMDGWYRHVRHPNYLGEIIFQVGLMMAWLGQPADWYDYALCLIAPAYIVVLMIHAAVEADSGQGDRHGGDPAYAAWRERSGCLLPGL